MKKIVFATGNAGKMKEIREILADLPVEIYSMKEAGISVEIDENGKSTDRCRMHRRRHDRAGG